MTPMLYESITRDRMESARERARGWRLGRASARADQTVTAHTLREAVGHGLIAVGRRLAKQPAPSDVSGLRRAA